jgi:hypothetical protein
MRGRCWRWGILPTLWLWIAGCAGTAQVTPAPTVDPGQQIVFHGRVRPLDDLYGFVTRGDVAAEALVGLEVWMRMIGGPDGTLHSRTRGAVSLT